MLLTNLQVVFSRRGEREEVLADAAGHMLAAFHALLERLLAPPPARRDPAPAPGSPKARSPKPQPSQLSEAPAPTAAAPDPSAAPAQAPEEAGLGLRPASAAAGAVRRGQDLSQGAQKPTSCNAAAGRVYGGSLGALLRAWDRAWVAYLEQFVAWKCADAASLEAELVRAAAEMESSMLAKLGPSLSPRPRSPADLQVRLPSTHPFRALPSERITRRSCSTRVLQPGCCSWGSDPAYTPHPWAVVEPSGRLCAAAVLGPARYGDGSMLDKR